MRWRVGSGIKIKIRGDKWLPTPSSFKVQSLVKSFTKEATLNELIGG